MNEQEERWLTLFQEDFHANRTALAENVWHLMMSVICGASYFECISTLEPDGLWRKMYQGYCQVKMDGSLEEFSGTWPKQGIVYGGTAFQPTLPEPHFSVNASPLWARPIASDGFAWTKTKKSNPIESIVHMWNRHGQDRSIYDFMFHGISATQAADYQEMMMGFPKHWTDLNASETL